MGRQGFGLDGWGWVESGWVGLGWGLFGDLTDYRFFGYSILNFGGMSLRLDR